MSKTIRIIRPSSEERTNLLPERIVELESLGFRVLYEPLTVNPDWTYTAGTIRDRVLALENALIEPESDIVLCARGGYGASDLLPYINWKKIAASKEKMLIGFSDISAIHSALYTKCDWKGLHAPMPATSLWRKNGNEDIDQLISTMKGKVVEIAFPVQSLKAQTDLEGELFGGCFSVLTNLIGTPYFPKKLKDKIIFIEDIGENPARLIRFLNQWIQSGVLQEARGILLGSFTDLGEAIPDSASYFLKEFASRIDMPVFHAPKFGHISPNVPMQIGAKVAICKGLFQYVINLKENIA